MRYRWVGVALLWSGLCGCPQTLKYPEFFKEPDLGFRGPVVQVAVQAQPFAIQVQGDAELEQLDPYRVRLTSKSGRLKIALGPGEAIYGLTERIVAGRKKSERHVRAIGGLDRRGELVSMWVLPSEAVYVPFYISSSGYGMLIEGSEPGLYDIGRKDPNVLEVGWEVGPEGFSCVFIQGPAYTEILDRYTAMTGRPILPPKWALRPWKWRDACVAGKFSELDGIKMNADVVDDITNYEKLGFPKGVYLIDRPWALGKADFELGPEAKAKGLVIGDRNLDYTNPAAVAWHREKIEAFLRRSGVDGWKLDRGDEYNPSSRHDIYADGRDGLSVHNDYVRLYIKTYYDATAAVRGDDFLLMARPGYTGTTAWSITWGGDIPGAIHQGRVGTDKGLRSAIISLQRMAFLGYPVWGTDTGGYAGFKDREVFARWLAFSAFCPLMEIGGVGPHEPWAMPEKPFYDEEMIRIYRRYTQLHLRLLDYTYELAERAAATGDPIVHPLVFDWPDDPQVKNRWDEYLYGPALLVAPVWEQGRREREVYLPAGEWKDLWNPSRTFQGPATIKVEAPLDRIPVFIRTEKADLLPKGIIEAL